MSSTTAAPARSTRICAARASRRLTYRASRRGRARSPIRGASRRASSSSMSAIRWSWSRLFATLELLQLAEHRVDVDLLLLARLRRDRRAEHVLGARRRRAGGGDLGGNEGLTLRGLGLRAVLGGAVDLEIEIDLRTQAKRHRVHRLQVGAVPMAALADRLQGVFGGADEPHDLRVLELGMVAQQPE